MNADKTVLPSVRVRRVIDIFVKLGINNYLAFGSSY
jgi:hypothetical protein